MDGIFGHAGIGDRFLSRFSRCLGPLQQLRYEVSCREGGGEPCLPGPGCRALFLGKGEPGVAGAGSFLTIVLPLAAMEG